MRRKKSNIAMFNRYGMICLNEYINGIERECAHINDLLESEITIVDIESTKINLANITKRFMTDEYINNIHVNVRKKEKMARRNLNRLFYFLDKKKDNLNIKIYPFVGFNFNYFNDKLFRSAKEILLNEVPEEYSNITPSNNFRELFDKTYNNFSCKNPEFEKYMKILDKYNIYIINNLYSFEEKK